MKPPTKPPVENDHDNTDNDNQYDQMSMEDFYHNFQLGFGGKSRHQSQDLAPLKTTPQDILPTPSGLIIPKTAQSLVEQQAARVAIKKEDWGYSRETFNTREKKVCRKLDITLTPPKYEDVISHNSKDLDLADVASNWQQAVEHFGKWAEKYDVKSISMIPSNFNIATSDCLNTSEWRFLITDFHQFDLNIIKSWQIFLNRYSGALRS